MKNMREQLHEENKAIAAAAANKQPVTKTLRLLVRQALEEHERAVA
jgi:hypothetical protein